MDVPKMNGWMGIKAAQRLLTAIEIIMSSSCGVSTFIIEARPWRLLLAICLYKNSSDLSLSINKKCFFASDLDNRLELITFYHHLKTGSSSKPPILHPHPNQSLKLYITQFSATSFLMLQFSH